MAERTSRDVSIHEFMCASLEAIILKPAHCQFLAIDIILRTSMISVDHKLEVRNIMVTVRRLSLLCSTCAYRTVIGNGQL